MSMPINIINQTIASTLEANTDHCEAKIIITSQNLNKTCQFQLTHWTFLGFYLGQSFQRRTQCTHH